MPQLVIPNHILHYIVQVAVKNYPSRRFAAASEAIGRGPCLDRDKIIHTPLRVHWVDDPILQSFNRPFWFFLPCLWIDRAAHDRSTASKNPDLP